MAAGTPPREHACPSLYVVEVTRRRGQARDASRRRGDCPQAEGARPTLPGTLVREVRQDPRGLDDSASPRRQHGDHAATKGIALLPQGIAVQWQPPRGGGLDPASEVSTEKHCVTVRGD